jgi:hypothetical protein
MFRSGARSADPLRRHKLSKVREGIFTGVEYFIQRDCRRVVGIGVMVLPELREFGNSVTITPARFNEFRHSFIAMIGNADQVSLQVEETILAGELV